MKAFIPNFITLLNLLMGCIGVFYASQDDLILAGIFGAAGIFLDFFDGFAARLLKVSSDLGKQLDSLADMVTSGLLPGFVMFQLIRKSINSSDCDLLVSNILLFSFIGFVITLGSAYRLAQFNIDENQTDKFIGLPTPANTILILSIPFILDYENLFNIATFILNPYFLIALALLSAFLLNMKVELFSLKLKSLQFKENKTVFLFLIFSIVCLVFLQFLGIPIVIVSYILVSILTKKNRLT